MKFTVSSKNFSKALGVVSRIANPRSSLPILGNVLIKAEKSRVIISSTNLNIANQVMVGAKVEGEGSTTIPARLLQEYISSISGDTIKIEVKDNKANISTDLHKTLINGIPAKDFPEMPSVSTKESWEIEANILKKYLSKTIVCASTDDTKPILNSIYIFSKGGKIHFASTDSYRLAEQTQKGEIAHPIILPSSTAAELIRILPDNDTVVRVKNTPQLAAFKFEETKLITRLIEGTFPDYKNLIPKEFENQSTVSKKELATTVKLAGLFARESAGSINISTNEEAQTISIKTLASQTGQNTSSIPAEVKGTAEITINERYISDAIYHIEEDTVSLCFNQKLQPFVIKGQDPNYLQVIMPLKS